MIITASPSLRGTLTIEYRDPQRKASNSFSIRKGQTLRINDDDFRDSPAFVQAVNAGLISIQDTADDTVTVQGFDEKFAEAAVPLKEEILQEIGELGVPENTDATRIADGSVDNTEYQYLAGVTSPIQGQLDTKLATNATGIAATQIANGSVSNAEFQRVAGVTAAIQTQLNAKMAANATGIGATQIADGSVSNDQYQCLFGVTSAIQSQLNGKLATNATGIGATQIANGSVSNAEYQRLAGVTSAIQTQINAKQNTIDGGASSIAHTDLTADKALISDANGKVAVSTIAAQDLEALSGVTGNVQDQIDTHLEDLNNPHQVTLGQVVLQDNVLENDINADNQFKIVNLPDPTADGDAATKKYVDLLASGLTAKDAVRLATTASLPATYNSGVLTATGNGALTLDSTPVLLNNRVLVKNETDKTINGIYVVTAVGAADAPFILTRAADFDESSEITNGTFVFVSEGVVNISAGFVLATPNPITVDVTDLNFVQYSKAESITAGSGLTKTGSEISAVVDGQTVTISGNQIKVKDGGITNAKLDKTNIPLSGFGAATANVSLGNRKITNLAAPTANGDAARKDDVDTVQSNLTGHILDTNNPHEVTAEQIGADVAGSAEAVQTSLGQHTGDATIHFTEGSISHANIQNIGSNSHVQIDSHIADASIHFAEASIDHNAIQNIGTKSHVQIDSHINDATVHFTEGSISHANIIGVGTKTHAQIDTHINSTANPHTTTLEQARSANAAISGNIDANGNTVVNLAAPTNDADAATKGYVDSVATGLIIKDPARVATTTELSATYNALSLTSTSNGAVTIDSILLALNDRVVVKDQTDQTHNGIFYVAVVGSISAPWVLTRATDFDQTGKISNGDFVFISEGLTNAATGWVVTSPNPITLDVSNISFSQFSSTGLVNAGAGLTKTGNVLSVNTDNTSIHIASNNVAVKDGGITNAKLDKANIPISGFGAANTTISLGGQRIISLSTPSAGTDAANKDYVDTTFAPTITTAGSGLNKSLQTLSVNTDNASTTILSNNVIVKDAGITNAKLDKSNIPLSGFGAAAANVDVGGYKLTNVGSPTANTDAATKGYADPQTVSVSTNTVAAVGQMLLVSTASSAVTITLPTATTNTNRSIIIKKVSSDYRPITIQANGAETIDGKNAGVLDGPYDTIVIISNGSNWFIK
jgi:hypothetical protein